MNRIAKEPFQFFTRQNLTYLLGKKAKNLNALLTGIKEIPLASIYQHTHHFLEQHEYLSPEPPNDFAYWITNVLQNNALGEEIAGIDLRQFSSLKDIQVRLVEIVENSIQHDPESANRNVPAGEEFHFMGAQTFVFPTQYIANDLMEFKQCLGSVSNYSIYYHMFEAPLFQEKSRFCYWIQNSLEDEKLALAFKNLDPYTQTLDNLKHNLVRLVRVRLEGK
ncbi:MAG: hypothetical protein C0417_01495 [Chlorobiaceae bacterium]|nr:hypothetical protein [Chlorobiaceae bacterium]